MNGLRVSLGIRNSHHPLRNLLYVAWQRYARFKSDAKFAPRDAELAARLRACGLAVLGKSDVDALAQLVDEKFTGVALENGFAQLPRRYNSLLVPHLYRVLQEHRGAIEAYYRSYFRVNWFEVQRIAPGQQSAGTSFGYHTDDTPNPVIKLFIYLTDTAESNGAFRAFEYPHTDELLKRGMLQSVSPGEARLRAQQLVPAEFESKLTVVEGPKGTVFVFDNNLIHKGTLPRQGMRTHVSLELMPAAAPFTEASLYYKCDEPISEYFPVNPFRPAGRGRYVRLSLRRRVRRYLNGFGIDIVRSDAIRPSNLADQVGAKPPVPERIIIGGGDYVYGTRWHNIEYVTKGYADRYKSLPKNIDIAHDLTAGEPFPIRDATLEAAYTSHVVEHLKDEHVQAIFRDTWRVLKPGGVFRISCPNIDLYLRALLERDLDFFHYRNQQFFIDLRVHDSLAGLFLAVFATQLCERATKPSYEEVRGKIETLGAEQALDYYANQAPYDYAKSHYHVNWFNPAKLTRMLRQAGFSDIYLSALGQSYYRLLRDQSLFDTGDPKISLYLECRK